MYLKIMIKIRYTEQYGTDVLSYIDGNGRILAKIVVLVALLR